MSTQSQVHRFKAYYQDSDLLIQFVVSEFILLFEQTKEFKRWATDYLNPDLTETAHQLTNMLHEILGAVPRSSIPSWNRGPLTRLKEYTAQLYLNTQPANELVDSLNTYAYRSWINTLHCIESLHTAQHNPAKQPAIKQALHNLQTSLNGITRLIPLVLRIFSDNDYVLLFLLRKKEPLVSIYGPSFVSKFLKTNKNVDKKAELLHSFKDKGFDLLLFMREQYDQP